mmetsp:Transcript_11462/g.27397  ORF Transcript_11462/g.27397 Transcript_11462/m.27397 type:complete len:1373 (-) Transcript_11462:161-4279(-)
MMELPNPPSPPSSSPESSMRSSSRLSAATTSLQSVSASLQSVSVSASAAESSFDVTATDMESSSAAVSTTTTTGADEESKTTTDYSTASKTKTEYDEKNSYGDNNNNSKNNNSNDNNNDDDQNGVLTEERAEQLRRMALEADAKPLPKMTFLGIREDSDGMMVLDAKVVHQQPPQGAGSGGLPGGLPGSSNINKRNTSGSSSSMQSSSMDSSYSSMMDDSTVVSTLTDYTGLRSMYSTQSKVSAAAGAASIAGGDESGAAAAAIAKAVAEAKRTGRDPQAAKNDALMELRIKQLAAEREQERERERRQHLLLHGETIPEDEEVEDDDDEDATNGPKSPIKMFGGALKALKKVPGNAAARLAKGNTNSNVEAPPPAAHDGDGDDHSSPESINSRKSHRSGRSMARSIDTDRRTTEHEEDGDNVPSSSRTAFALPMPRFSFHFPGGGKNQQQQQGNTTSPTKTLNQQESLIGTAQTAACSEKYSFQNQPIVRDRLSDAAAGAVTTDPLNGECADPTFSAEDEEKEEENLMSSPYDDDGYGYGYGYGFGYDNPDGGEEGGENEFLGLDGGDGLEYIHKPSSTESVRFSPINRLRRTIYVWKNNRAKRSIDDEVFGGHDKQNPEKRKAVISAIVAIIVLVLIIAVSVAVSQNKKDKFDSLEHPGSKETKPPASAPTAPPQSDVIDDNGIPVNDICVDATAVFAGVPIRGTTENSSPISTGLGCGIESSDGGGVWYVLTGTGSDVTASTCGGSAADGVVTQISVLEAGPGNEETFLQDFATSCSEGNLSCLTQNDVSSGDNCSSDSKVSFSTNVGHVYFVVVRGVDGASGPFELSLEAGVPSNDECENAELIDWAVDPYMYGSTVGASVDDATCDGITPDGNGVWYTLVGNGEKYVLSTCWGTAFDTRISVFGGSCRSLSCIGANDDFCGRQSRVSFQSNIGETYLVLVHGYQASAGDFYLNIAVGDDLYNDFCPDATQIELNQPMAGDNKLARFDFAGEEICGDGVQITGPTVWYTVTGTGGELMANVCNPDFDSQVSVFSGSCDDMTCVGGTSNDASASCGSGNGYTWQSEAFETYKIAVHGVNQAVGTFSFSVDDLGGEPAFRTCDDAAGPIPLLGTSTFVADSDSEIQGSLMTCSSGSSSSMETRTGSWMYIVGDGGGITASMCNNDGGGSVHVFSGPSCSDLDCVGDDSGCFKFFNTEPGEIYRLFVESETGGVKDLSLSTTGPPPSSNDDCIGAIPLVIDGDVITGSTADANVDIVPLQSCGTEVVSPGVWFSVVGTGGEIAASLCEGTSFDTVISVFEGPCGDLKCIGGNDDFCDLQSAFSWETERDTTYYVLVHGFEPTDVGDFGVSAISRNRRQLRTLDSSEPSFLFN